MFGSKSNQMEVKLVILQPFFENPHELFHIREVAKLTKINHTTVRKYLQEFVKERILVLKKEKLYDSYAANVISDQYLFLKLYFNLEKIRISGLLEKISLYYAKPTVVLFGDYAKAADNKESIVGICVVNNTLDKNVKELQMQNFFKILQREIRLCVYPQKEFLQLRRVNPALFNQICNGIVLRGNITVVESGEK